MTHIGIPKAGKRNEAKTVRVGRLRLLNDQLLAQQLIFYDQIGTTASYIRKDIARHTSLRNYEMRVKRDRTPSLTRFTSLIQADNRNSQHRIYTNGKIRCELRKIFGIELLTFLQIVCTC